MTSNVLLTVMLVKTHIPTVTLRMVHVTTDVNADGFSLCVTKNVTQTAWMVYVTGQDIALMAATDTITVIPVTRTVLSHVTTVDVTGNLAIVQHVMLQNPPSGVVKQVFMVIWRGV